MAKFSSVFSAVSTVTRRGRLLCFTFMVYGNVTALYLTVSFDPMAKILTTSPCSGDATITSVDVHRILPNTTITILPLATAKVLFSNYYNAYLTLFDVFSYSNSKSGNDEKDVKLCHIS